MAYRLKSKESVPEGIKRVVKEELEAGLDQLNGKSRANRDEAVHEARKSVKKIRAVLRLMRPELNGAYDMETRRLRTVGRKLSEFRDAGAIVETFDNLKKKYRNDLRKHSLDSIRRRLVKLRDEAEKKVETGDAFKKLAGTLEDAAKDVKTWPLQTDGFSAIAPGIEDAFRRARRAMVRARKDPRPENFHEWRKAVKDHWYHVRLLESLWSDVMRAHEKSLKDLESWLGEDHNLVVLRERIVADPDSYGGQKETDLVLDLIDKYQKELRDNALSLGERIYEERLRQFTRRMKHLWLAWQTQPKSLEQQESEGDQQKAQPGKIARKKYRTSGAAA
jgi:CHAD domain-containing protein